MGKRLYFGKNPPKSFAENIVFSAECPYNIRYKEFTSEDIAPLHYGSSIEIDLFRDVSGTITFNSTRLNIKGDLLLALPPNTVHSTFIHQNSGYGYVIQVSLNDLKPALDIEKMFLQGNRSLEDMCGLFQEIDKFESLINQIVEHDEQPISRNRILLEMFELLYDQLRENRVSSTFMPSNSSEDLLHVIEWTQEHFREPITLSTVAATVCLSKNYFCSWFKTHTSMSYNRYLNNVRINKACEYLEQGKTIKEAAYQSGFSDISYFTQLFKKLLGCTPKGYLEISRKNKADIFCG